MVRVQNFWLITATFSVIVFIFYSEKRFRVPSWCPRSRDALFWGVSLLRHAALGWGGHQCALRRARLWVAHEIHQEGHVGGAMRGEIEQPPRAPQTRAKHCCIDFDFFRLSQNGYLGTNIIFKLALSPGPFPIFQCYMLKGRRHTTLQGWEWIWYIMSIHLPLANISILDSSYVIINLFYCRWSTVWIFVMTTYPR